MSTTGRGRHSALRIFKGRRGRTGRRSTCGALPAAGPYLRLSRFQGWQAIRTDGRSARAHAPSFTAAAAPSYSSGPGHCPDGRSDERFARQYRCGPPPEFPLASPRSGIVHHLSGPDTHAHTRTLHKRSGSVGGAPVKEDPHISFLAPTGLQHPSARTHVRLLGPCFKTGRMGARGPLQWARESPGRLASSARAVLADRPDGASSSVDRPGSCRREGLQRSAPRAEQRTGHSHSASGRDAPPAPSASLPTISSTL
ncbi:hypothetical protein IEQ34_026198 [Dendrobium chrysotoxum]|uniref:Uncharacterized protein n=1 Tax=Dendrobium chrysotoxum TaxID=161865 RepID=A0AAV7FN64_DENCH|nr:hypothetical protein IEQ34_026198 [Dendrobium chrysotoxum]